MNKKSIIFIIITAICFGTMEVASKLAGFSFHSIQLVFIRFFIGGIFLLPFAIKELKKRKIKLTPGDLGYLLGLGVICVCISMAMFQYGVKRINANLASIIISMNPLFTMVFAHFLLHESFTKRKALVLLVSFAGLLIILQPGSLMSGKLDTAGLMITLGAAVTFALYTALGKLRLERLGGMVQNSFSFLIGSAVLLIYMLPAGIPVVKGITVASLPLLLYLGIVVTGIGYYAFLKAIELAGPSNASIAFFIKPVVAPVASLVVLGENITLNFVIGVLFILAGSYINMKAPAKKAAV